VDELSTKWGPVDQKIEVRSFRKSFVTALYEIHVAEGHIKLGTSLGKVEAITNLKGLVRATGPGGTTAIGVAPDGSPVLTRDIGTHEIYALNVKWP